MTAGVPREEFAEIAVTYLNQLYLTARRLTRCATDADDLVQDTYRLAFEHYRELRSLADCRAWLYRILRRQAVTQYRRSRCGASLVLLHGGADDPGETTAPTPLTDAAIERLSFQEVRRAIDALPDDLQLAVTLCDIEGFRYDEIATITEVPVGTVRSRIARARAKLMMQLQEHAAACGIGQREPCATVQPSKS